MRIPSFDGFLVKPKPTSTLYALGVIRALWILLAAECSNRTANHRHVSFVRIIIIMKCSLPHNVFASSAWTYTLQWNTLGDHQTNLHRIPKSMETFWYSNVRFAYKSIYRLHWLSWMSPRNLLFIFHSCWKIRVFHRHGDHDEEKTAATTTQTKQQQHELQ